MVDSSQVARPVLTNEYPLTEDAIDLFQTIDKDGVDPRDLFVPFIVGNIQTLQNPLLESIRDEVVALCKMWQTGRTTQGPNHGRHDELRPRKTPAFDG